MSVATDYQRAAAHFGNNKLARVLLGYVVLGAIANRDAEREQLENYLEAMRRVPMHQTPSERERRRRGALTRLELADYSNCESLVGPFDRAFEALMPHPYSQLLFLGSVNTALDDSEAPCVEIEHIIRSTIEALGRIRMVDLPASERLVSSALERWDRELLADGR